MTPSEFLYTTIRILGSFCKEEGLTVLTYHSIDESGSKISVAPSKFARQMQFLKEHRYQVLPLSQVSRLLKAREPFPADTVVLTFDDGYHNTYSHAFPVLQAYGFPATVFVATQFCGKRNEWPQPGVSVPPLPMLSWKEIDEMSRYQVEIGAHTHTHPNLAGLPPSEVEKEVLTSKRTIEEKTGNPCSLFAYPFGHVEKRMKGLIASEFATACSGRLNHVTFRSDLHSLERVDVGYAPHLSAFQVLISRSFYLYLPIKRGHQAVVRRFR